MGRVGIFFGGATNATFFAGLDAKLLAGLGVLGGVQRIGNSYNFIFDEKRGEPCMLEINTVPGQSEASIVPQQVRAMGWTLKQFYSALIEEALSRRQPV